ncbi:MAG TPA: PAS domain S-box protein, partial [Burkholderiales bacterium]|nr:PAS domain S-box protein [Burkholderiales bacterium]
MHRLFDRAGVGIAQIDTSGRYLLVNDWYCRLIGRQGEDVLAASIQEYTHPDDLATSLDAFIRVIETGVPATVEHRHVRADGSETWISNTVSLGRNEAGEAEYVLILAQDIAARKETERALVRAQSDLRMLLDSAADGFYCIDRDGRTTLCNAAFLRMTGFEREEDVLGRDMHDLIHRSLPEGFSHSRDDCPVLKTARTGTHAHVSDEHFLRRDGKGLAVEYWARPIVRDGQIQGAVCTFVDATGHQQSQARQQLMNREMAHRMKNTLAMVQAIVGQTLRRARNPQDAIQSVNQRLAALGHAHTALTRTRWGNASIMEVVEATAAHAERGRVRISGPKMDLGAKAVLAITLALHELSTNAAKYGALSNENGTVTIEWAVTGGAADSRFRLSWTERGGPAVSP